jgi:hypothetical protein
MSALGHERPRHPVRTATNVRYASNTDQIFTTQRNNAVGQDRKRFQSRPETAAQRVERRSLKLYLGVASGSIPLLLIPSDARGEARNSISRLEASISFEPATTAAENT